MFSAQRLKLEAGTAEATASSCVDRSRQACRVVETVVVDGVAEMAGESHFRRHCH